MPLGPRDEAYDEDNDSVAQARDDVLADHIHCFNTRVTGEETDDSGWPSAADEISQEESADGEADNGEAVPSAVSSGSEAPAWAQLPVGDVAAATTRSQAKRIED